MTLVYRLGQGARALLAFTQPVELALAERYLSPPLMALFRSMRRDEQLHSLNVLRSVLTGGEPTPALAVAALLHDVGKTRYPIAVWQKTLAVTLKTLLPERYRRWSTGDPAHPLQRPCVVYVHHPAWSAEMLRQAGAEDAAIWLVEHHAEPLEQWSRHPLFAQLGRLRQADDAN
jgi:hypothetical protein